MPVCGKEVVRFVLEGTPRIQRKDDCEKAHALNIRPSGARGPELPS